MVAVGNVKSISNTKINAKSIEKRTMPSIHDLTSSHARKLLLGVT
jgi:hypothetical protein